MIVAKIHPYIMDGFLHCCIRCGSLGLIGTGYRSHVLECFAGMTMNYLC